jgi:rhamnosyltransferase
MNVNLINEQPKRLTILAHFDQDNRIDDHVVFYAASMKRISSFLLVVTTAAPSSEELAKLNEIADRIIVRENVGYDFMSWKTGLENVDLTLFDELILCNDSVYGPLWPIDAVFQKMAKRKCDFWGLTANKKNVCHLQSYFIVFRKALLNSEYFKTFWASIKILDQKQEIIDKYEIGMTSYFTNMGFKSNYVFHFRPQDFLRTMVDRKFIFRKFRKAFSSHFNPFHMNPTLVFWDAMLKSKIPFLKVELVKFCLAGKSPAPSYDLLVEKIVARGSAYPTELIANHIHRVAKAASNFALDEKKGL